MVAFQVAVSPWRLQRDHSPDGFNAWLYGVRVKAGKICAETDELGYHAVERNAKSMTCGPPRLHQTGIDHEKPTYRHGGREFGLNDVRANVCLTSSLGFPPPCPTLKEIQCERRFC